MLYTGERAAALNTAHIGGRELAGEIGILRKVLEIPPAKRTPLDVESRPEQHIHSLRARLVSERFAHRFGKFRVPAVCNGRRRRKAGRGTGGMKPEVIPDALLLPETVRPVRKEKSRQAPSRECPALPGAAPG